MRSEPRPLRVAHMVWGGDGGGIQRLVSDLVRAQAVLPGISAGVLACGLRPDDADVLRFAAPGVTVLTGGMGSTFDVGGGRFRAVVAKLSLADVVHMHGFTPSLAAAARLAGRPVVFTEHGMLGLDCRWPSRQAVKHTAKGFYLRHAVSRIVCVSAWVAESARRRYGLDGRRLRVVSNGVDFARLRTTRSRDAVLLDEGIDPSTFVVAVAARLAEIKRIDRLLDAVRLLGSRRPDWALLVIGSGPLEDALRRRARLLGVSDRVHFLGWREPAWDYLAAADVVVLPSARESFGLAVVEAMALGRPVIAFADSGGPTEVIEAVGGGRVVDSVPMLGSVLDQLRVGEGSAVLRSLDRDRLTALYDYRTTAKTYADLYLAAVREPSDRASGGA